VTEPRALSSQVKSSQVRSSPVRSSPVKPRACRTVVVPMMMEPFALHGRCFAHASASCVGVMPYASASATYLPRHQRDQGW
jgi:hypothetical protein